MKCKKCGKELTWEEVRSNEKGDWICTCCKKVREVVKKERKRIKNNRTPNPPNKYPPQVNPLDNKVIELKEQRDELLKLVKDSISMGYYPVGYKMRAKKLIKKIEGDIDE